MTVKKAFRKALKIIAWIAGSIILLLIILLILIQIPSVQNFAKNKIVAYLEDKIHTKVSIEKLSIAFPKQIVLEKVYMEDQQKDTLLYAGKLQVDIALFKLLSNTVEVSYLELDDMYANVKRLKPDTAFNFDYIIKAFASSPGDKSYPSDTSSMKFKLGNIVLNNIRTAYKDDVTGMDASFRLGNFSTSIKTFDPTLSDYNINDINISNVVASVRQYKPLIAAQPLAVVEAKSNEPIKIKLQLGKVSLKQVSFNYKNDVSALTSNINLGEFLLVPKQIDLQKLYVNLDQVKLNNSSIAVVLGNAPQAETTKDEISKHVEAQTNNPWKLEVASISLDSNQFKYDDNTKPKTAKGIDYSHIGLSNFSMATNNLVVSPNGYQGQLSKLAFKEQSGLQVIQLKTAFQYDDKHTTLDNLVLQTNNSTIHTNLRATYPSIDSITKNPSAVYIDALLSNTSLAVKDILIINPSLESQLKGYQSNVLKINAAVKGRLNDLDIPAFAFSGYGQTNVQLKGNVKGLPDSKNAYYNIDFSRLNTTKKDIIALLPKNTLPNTIELPDVINTSGYFKGTVNSFNGRLNAKTNKGNADITTGMTDKGKSYNIKAILSNVDLGYILKQPDNFGKVSLQASAKGSGMDYKTMNTVLNATVSSADVKGYTYKDVNLDAKFNSGTAVIKSTANDPNMRYSFEATAGLKTKYPSLQMQLQLDTLNLYALHLMDSLLTLHAVVNADMQSTNPDSLIGNLTIANTNIVKGNTSYTTDSIKLVAAREGSTQSIIFSSEAATLDWKGEYKLTETGDDVMQTIKRYYHFPYKTKDTVFAPQNWVMNLLINPSAPLVLQFVPNLKGSDTIGAHISFNSAANDLQVQMKSPVIKYGTQTINNLRFSAATKASQLNYALAVDNAGSPSFMLNESSVTGNLANNELFTNIVLKDSKEKDRYHLAAKINQPDTNSYRFSLSPDSLLLNYDKWQISNDNFIQYDTTGIIAHNFTISNKEQSLTINSQSQSTTAPVDVTFKDFRIKTLTNFAEQDSLFMDGVINGITTVKNILAAPVFTSDLTIKDLSYKTDTVGTVTVKVDNETANAFNANVKIQGNGNDVQLAGKYYTVEGKMDMKLDVNNIDLSTIKNFTAGQLKDAGGSLKGNVTIAGTTAKPDINGTLHFTNAFVAPTLLGARLNLNNEEIVIVNNEGLTFNNFTLTDSAGSKAVLNGKVITSDFKDYRFDLGFKADNFTFINSTKSDNQLFYGSLNMDANVTVAGPMNAPSIKAFLRANKNTDLTFVLPSDDPEVVSREGVVNFIDMDSTQGKKKIIALDSAVVYKSLAGLNVDVTIETDTAAALTLVIDERNGDALRVKGSADLTGGIDQSGKLSLTGNYQLEDGSYQVTLSILKRKFTIQNGSVITFKGSPTDADVDITAVYNIKTSPIDLMESQLAGRAQTEVNKYKQKIPIQVLLKMKGQLLKPQITFDIVLPESTASQWKDVDDKIAQVRTNESEMNKQVFALLLLGRFTQEDPFETAGGSSNEAVVRQSVSRILTDQLNKLASNLVKGVDLNIGLNSDEDYSTGVAANRTDLTVGVSKSLLNDRLRVSVGSNFQVEGPATTTQNTSNIAGDVSLDYQLTKNGRYRLRAYRVNQYEGVVEGQVVETGLTFIFTLDYDQFREIFNKPKKIKKKK